MRMMTYKNLNIYIQNYFKMIDDGLPVSKEILLARDKILKDMAQPGVYTDDEMVEECVKYIEKWYYELFPWEKFVIALVFTYKDDDLLYNEIFIMMGRGNGKNGFISGLANFLQTNKHGIKKYGVDIVANSEEQAMTSFNDVLETLEDNEKLGKAFKFTKEEIVNIKTRSYLKYRTSNAKTKDGLRPGCIIFDELHQYENYDSIKVFTSALGKIPFPRTFIISTDGNVRGGVLDDYKEDARLILMGDSENTSMLPLIWKMDDVDEIEDESLRVKANPSLPYLPNLKKQIQTDVIKSKTRPQMRIELLTKRFNLPVQDTMTRVATYEEVKATNREVPDLAGLECIGAVDFSSVRDFTSCILLFKLNGCYYVIHHTFICYKSLELYEYNVDIERAKQAGQCTVLKTETIDESVVAEWFNDMRKKYYIKDVVCDTYRASVLKNAFESIGLKLTEIRHGGISHNKVAPLVERIFAEHLIIWGDDVLMRWYVGNVYTEKDRRGNTSYNKIEPIKRKTDGFFALLGALGKETEIVDGGFDMLQALKNITR